MFDLFSDPVKVSKQLDIIMNEFGFATWETLYSLVLEVGFAYLIGLPLGVLLVTGEREGIKPLPKPVMTVLNVVINLLRSVPFLILMIIALPLSKIIVGTKVGTMATIPPMIIAAFPMVARMVESSLREVDHGVIEAAQSMGLDNKDIIFRVYLKESIAGIARGTTITIISLIGLTAMAVAIGAGGLGNFAIMYGHQRNMPDITYTTVVVLVIIVTVVQLIGNYIAKKNTH